MKKKQAIFLVIALLVLCLAVLASCNRAGKTVTLEDYEGEQGLEKLNAVGKLVRQMHLWLGKGNYGWVVVIFTVCLKLLMLPLDIWQRLSIKKSSEKMKQVQPLLDQIEKKYGNNQQKANEEKQKLLQKQGISTLGSCLPLIVTMIVFFVMFGGLTSYSTYKNVTDYASLLDYYNEGVETFAENHYDDVLNGALLQDMTESQAKIIADQAQITFALKGEYDGEKVRGSIAEYYQDNVQESFLWIENIWQPDTWVSIMPTIEKFTVNIESTSNSKTIYNNIRGEIVTLGRGNDGKWNGLMILPFLSIGLSFLSVFVNQRLEKSNKNSAPVQNDQQAASNKTMMIMMPLMMAYFGFIYTGAFAIYMVCNYALSILSTVALNAPINKAVQKSLEKSQLDVTPKASYKR